MVKCKLFFYFSFLLFPFLGHVISDSLHAGALAVTSFDDDDEWWRRCEWMEVWRK